MASKAQAQSAFLAPQKTEDVSLQDQTTPEKKKLRGHATIYDAVAGRVSATGFIPDTPYISRTRGTVSSSSVAAAPEAVLFRRKNAPTRYQENDDYFAHESLPENALPDSDLLKALHCYTSDYYSRASADGVVADFKSMDETALIALGILMEEMSRESLGKTGDLVFTEGEIQDEGGFRTIPRKKASMTGKPV